MRLEGLENEGSGEEKVEGGGEVKMSRTAFEPRLPLATAIDYLGLGPGFSDEALMFCFTEKENSIEAVYHAPFSYQEPQLANTENVTVQKRRMSGT